MVPDWLPSSPLIEALGWALLHSLWQCALLALLFASLQQVLRHSRAELRVVVGECILLLAVLLPVATTWSLMQPLGGSGGGAMTPGSGSSMWVGAQEVASQGAVMAVVVAVWAIGVLLLAARAAWRWQSLRGVVSRATPTSPAWQRRFKALCRQGRIALSVRWLESAEVAGPVLVGWLRPVILFPLGMTVGLPPRHIELLLAHELAHVRRADFLFNLFQLVVETLLFFNPAIHWISARVRHERELACDERVTAQEADRADYARALLSVAEYRQAHGGLALAANGGFLLQRVRRIVGDIDDGDPRGGGLRTLLVAGLLLGLLALGLRSVEPVLPAIKIPVQRVLGETLRSIGVEPVQLSVAGRPRIEALRPLEPESAVVLEGFRPAAALPSLADAARRAPAREALSLEAPLPDVEIGRPVLGPPGVAAADPARSGPLRSPAPAYPVSARIAGIEGWVELSYRIGSDGAVQAVRVTEALPAGVFDEAARDALSRWQFPASAGGEQRLQRFDFSLRGNVEVGEDTRQCRRPATGSRVCRRTPPIGG